MDDLISRQDAIDALGERPLVWSDNDDYTLGERNQYDMDRLAIETVPSAQPERKAGEWIDCNWSVRCSECDYSMPWSVRNYCPNCGADMRGEE